MSQPPNAEHRRRFSTEIKEQAVALAELTGNSSEAARQLGVPNQRVSSWLVHPDNAELRLRIQAKRLEAALEIAEELPDLLKEALAATRKVARSAEAVNNGTQARELATAVGVLETICARVIGNSSTGRYGREAAETRPALGPLEYDEP